MSSEDPHEQTEHSDIMETIDDTVSPPWWIEAAYRPFEKHASVALGVTLGIYVVFSAELWEYLRHGWEGRTRLGWVGYSLAYIPALLVFLITSLLAVLVYVLWALTGVPGYAINYYTERAFKNDSKQH